MFLFLDALRKNLALRDLGLGWVGDDYRLRAHDSQRERLSQPLLAFRGRKLACFGPVAEETALNEHGASQRADQHGVVLGMDAAIA